MRRAVRTSDGVDLAVVEFGGAGDPILLLHGLMGRATTWWAVAEKLTAFGRVLGLEAGRVGIETTGRQQRRDRQHGWYREHREPRVY